jgi:hypothetical protein
LWNIAADYAVNQILKDSNIGEMPKMPKAKKRASKTTNTRTGPAERIYDDLYKNAKKNGKKFQRSWVS